MGYSVSAKADIVLSEAMKIVSDSDSSNVFRGYFYETGRENVDGAFTAQVMKIVAGGFAKRSGSIRIEADGTITRFPTMKPNEKKLAELRGYEEYKRIYGGW